MLNEAVQQNELNRLNKVVTKIIIAFKNYKPCQIKTRKKYVFWGEVEKYIDYGIDASYKDYELLEKMVLPELQKIHKDIIRIKFSTISSEWSDDCIHMRVYL